MFCPFLDVLADKSLDIRCYRLSLFHSRFNLIADVLLCWVNVELNALELLAVILSRLSVGWFDTVYIAFSGIAVQAESCLDWRWLR